MSACVGVDWGSTSFRAYRFDDKTRIVDTLVEKSGIKSITDNKFEQSLLSHIGEWLDPGDTVLLSGMITSRNGWHETPYLPAPLKLENLLDSAVKVVLQNNITGFFLPGVCMQAPNADVMRGEELQLYGAIDEDTSNGADRVVVLPGTHSKWARLSSGSLKEFKTIITGEIFDLLLNHSLVGGLASSKDWIESSFVNGVEYGYHQPNIITRLFTARSSVLLNDLQPQEVYSYLSGLLIGNECREADDMISNDAPVLLVGDDALVQKYQLALNLLSINSEIFVGQAAANGFQKLLKQGAINR